MDEMTVWSVLVEGPLTADGEPGEAELLLLEVMGDLGFADAVAGGAVGSRLAVRFSVPGFDLVDAAATAREQFLTAVDKAGVSAGMPDTLEIVPLAELARANSL